MGDGSVGPGQGRSRRGAPRATSCASPSRHPHHGLRDGSLRERTVAPAWQADQRLIYGAFFWINGDGAMPVPREAYYMSGAGGQTTLIIPSHDLVVVRLGHYKGSTPGEQAFNRALALLIDTVPRRP